jgi:LAGLIDADG DNA endonuclease family
VLANDYGANKMNKQELTRLLSAMVLGDGSLRRWRGVEHAAYGFSQIDTHKDYVEWQASILSELTKVNIYHYEPSTKDGISRQGYYKLESRSHPFYTTLYERMYFDNRKTVSTHDLLLFDWQSAAIWFMDDGYRLKSEDVTQRGHVFLSTDNYNHAEVILLQKAIYEKLKIPFNIRRRGYKKDGTILYRLVTTKTNADRFIEGVSPFIFPSFEYKLSSERKLST